MIVTSDNLNGGAYAENGSERHDGSENWRYKRDAGTTFKQPIGRWPANLVHDGEANTVNRFPNCAGGTWNRTDGARIFNNNGEITNYVTSGSDKTFGSASRFFKQVSVIR